MHGYGKIVTPGGICVGVATRTEDGKPALIVKQAKRNYYNVITLEALERQVLKVLKADKDRV